MPQIVDPLPQDLVASFAHLSAALDDVIPPRQLDCNILVATWNICAFGGTEEAAEAKARLARPAGG